MKLSHLTLGGLAIFLFGIVFGHVLATSAVNVTGAAIEQPASFGATGDMPMPRDRVSEDQIVVSQNRVVLNIQDASWSRFTDTNSMVPFLDQGANAIQITPHYPEELEVGDIISYHIGGLSLIHRIIATGHDGQGWYAVVKGDNNPSADPFKVRFDQIDRVLVAIVY